MPPSPSEIPLGLSQRYRYCCLDVWGVLFDGRAAFDDAQRFVARLLAADVGVFVFSNTPSTATQLGSELAGWGFPVDRLRSVATAGSYFLDCIQEAPARYGLGSSRRCYYIGPSSRRCTLDHQGFELGGRPESSDMIVIAGADDGHHGLDYYARLLRRAAELGVPACCINPDFAAPIGDSELAYCGGFVADVYRALGGTVHDFGKPGLDFYRRALVAQGVNAADCLYVGDDLETDIYAGTLFGAATLLLRRGYTARVLGGTDEARFLRHFALRRLTPTYLLPSLDAA